MAKTRLDIKIQDDGSYIVTKVAREFEKFEKASARAKKEVSGLEKETSAVGKAFQSATKYALGAVAAVASWRTVEMAVEAWKAQEQAVSRLDAVLRNVAPTFEYTSGQLQRMASQIQSSTVYGDEAVNDLQTRLLAFDRVQGPVFERAQQAAIDLASAYQMDLVTAAETVGKALQSPAQGVRSLEAIFGKLDPTSKRFIADLVAQGREGEATALVLEMIEGKVGGVAAAFVELSESAQIEQVMNRAGDVLEAFGQKLTKIQAQLAGLASPALDYALDQNVLDSILGSGSIWLKWGGDVGDLVAKVAELGSEMRSTDQFTAELVAKLQQLNRIDLETVRETALKFSSDAGIRGLLQREDSERRLREFISNLEVAIRVQDRFNESRRQAAAAIDVQAQAQARLDELQERERRRIEGLVKGREAIEKDLQASIRNTERLFRDTRIDELTRAKQIQSAYEQAMDALSKLDETYDGIGSTQGDIKYREFYAAWEAARAQVGDLEYEIKLSEDRGTTFERDAQDFFNRISGRNPAPPATEDEEKDPWKWVPWNKDYKKSVEAYEEAERAFLNSFKTVHQTVLDVWGEINSIEAQRHQDRISALRREAEEVARSYDIQVAAARAAGQETATIELEKLLALKQQNEKIQEAERKARVDAFNHQKAMSASQAAINGWEAATKAYSQGGPLFGPALALTIGALAAYQTGKILAEQPPQFADGGLLFPRPGGQTFRHGAGQKTFAEAGQPEAILPLSRLQEFVDIPRGQRALVVNLNIAAPILGLTEEDLYVNIENGIRKAVYDGRILQ